MLLLPGAWLGFGLPLERMSYVSRLAIAGTLSPAIAGVEFCLARWLGLPFNTAVWALVVFNLPAVCLLVWRRPAWRISWKSLAAFLAVYFVLAACVALPWLHSRNTRMFTGHIWMHIGIVNEFPGGAIVPEDPELAGVTLAYQWLGEAYWAVLGWVMAMPPTQVYVLTNLVSLLWACVLFYELCRVLGASGFASRIGLLWLGLGTNIAGIFYWLMTSFAGWHVGFPGDVRTTPWIRKFIVFESIVFALAMFPGLMLVSVQALQRRDRSSLLMAPILLATIGLIYPLLFPAALGFCGILLLFLWWQRRSERGQAGLPPAVWLFIGMCAATAAVLVNVHSAAAARSTPLLHLTSLIGMVAKSGTSVIAMALFLLAIYFVPGSQLRDKPVLLLLAGAVPSLALRSFVQLTAAADEYKFLFTAALCLAPVAALAVDRLVARRVPPLLLLAASAMLVLPAIPAIRLQQGMSSDTIFPQVEESGFYLQLGSGESDAGWVNAVRGRTSVDTVVVTRRSDLFLPAVMARSLWAPPQAIPEVPGYWINDRWNLVTVRGYAASILDKREAIVQCVYSCTTDAELRAAHAALVGLGRPVAVVFRVGEGGNFLSLLKREREGQVLYHDTVGTLVWLLQPPGSSPRPTADEHAKF